MIIPMMRILIDKESTNYRYLIIQPWAILARATSYELTSMFSLFHRSFIGAGFCPIKMETNKTERQINLQKRGDDGVDWIPRVSLGQLELVSLSAKEYTIPRWGIYGPYKPMPMYQHFLFVLFIPINHAVNLRLNRLDRRSIDRYLSHLIAGDDTPY
ncbi:hypothetical protein KQX54_001713 [Cotesia glomerata]|uniref:Uncharacterized protein n=1 Tax=Cotesia glomerata TaxID=32391 RepID=A0AAV7IVZ5_COTGL|nr:hypothetical protein KQX54_001713 [Cotesia glomerata]